MQDKAQRLLILGVGVLDGFRLNAFRAVIAHEYGYFSNRDTAGGDVAFPVMWTSTILPLPWRSGGWRSGITSASNSFGVPVPLPPHQPWRLAPAGGHGGHRGGDSLWGGPVRGGIEARYPWRGKLTPPRTPDRRRRITQDLRRAARPLRADALTSRGRSIR